MSSKTQTDKKNIHRRKDVNYEAYIAKVLKQVHPDTGISSSTLKGINAAIVGLANRLIHRSADFTRLINGKTISSREVHSAVRSLLSGEMTKHALSEGAKAVTKYNASLAGSVSPRKSAPRSTASRAGLTFSPSRTKRLIKILYPGIRVSEGAPVYLAATLEYITAEILELAGHTAHDDKRVRIKNRHFLFAIKNDEELKFVFRKTIIAGGVIPHIHQAVIAMIGSKDDKEKEKESQ
jgi:histone H2A